MQIKINDIPVCVISLPVCKERLIRTQFQLDNFYGRQSHTFYLIEGIRIPNIKSSVNIAQSHMNAIQLAKDNNWEYVCIVEDDVMFTSSNSKKYADECFNNIPEDFEILIGGAYGTHIQKNKNTHWNQITNFCGLHYYIVRNTCYDKILSFTKHCHIDLWLSRMPNKGAGLKCYVTNKYFVMQFDGFSYNLNRVTDYLSKIPVNRLLK